MNRQNYLEICMIKANILFTIVNLNSIKFNYYWIHAGESPSSSLFVNHHGLNIISILKQIVEKMLQTSLREFFNNSVFRKTKEFVRNRQKVRLVSSGKMVKKLCAKPHFLDFKIFNDILAAVHILQVSLAFLRPICVSLQF